jgi:hypothetical protein
LLAITIGRPNALFQGHSGHFESTLVHRPALRLGSLRKLLEVDSGQARIAFRDGGQCAPERPFTVNSNFQKFQRFKRAQAVGGYMTEFQARYFFAQPRSHFL